MRRITCIASDFDFTLSHFINPIEKGFFDIFRKRGWNDDDIEKVLGVVERQRGFSIGNFIDASKTFKHAVLNDEGAIRAEFEEWVEKSVTLYPDSLPFLIRWIGSVPIAIVTAGDPEYQKRKVSLVGIPYNELHVVAPPRKKWQILDELLLRYNAPVLFLEDKADELDKVWRIFGPKNVVTVLILREDSPHSEMARNFNHIKVRSLTEVNRLIKEER